MRPVIFFVSAALAVWAVIFTVALAATSDTCTDPSRIVRSPDGARVACKAWEGDKRVVVIGNGEGKQYDWTGAPVFSPNSQRVVYKVKHEEKWFVVYADRGDKQKEGKHYDEIISIIFYPQTHQYLGFFVFGPDSSLVYGAREGEKLFVVVDGKESNAYSETKFLVFSPNSARLAYKARRGDKWFVVLGDQEGEQYDWVGFPVFSPNSARLAYKARRGDKWFVVLGDQEGEQYDEVISLAPHPDSRRLDLLVFDPKSKEVTYKARRGDKWFVVVGNTEKEFENTEKKHETTPQATLTLKSVLPTESALDLEGEKNVVIQNLFERTTMRYDATHNEWLKVIGSRIESRLDKFAEEMGEDSPAFRLKLAQARLKISESEEYLRDAKLKFAGVLDDDDPRAVFGEVQKSLSDSLDTIKETHSLFVSIVSEIKEKQGKY